MQSLTADLRTFRLEEYNVKLREKNKLTHVYSEIQNYFSCKIGSNAVHASEDIRVIDEMWDKLDSTMQSREIQLEQSIAKFERLQSQYDKVNKDIRSITSNLNSHREQLEIVR